MNYDILYLILTMVATFGGILTSNSLTTWRIKELEKSIDKLNVERDTVIRNEGAIKQAHKRIDRIVEQLNIIENRDR